MKILGKNSYFKVTKRVKALAIFVICLLFLNSLTWSQPLVQENKLNTDSISLIKTNYTTGLPLSEDRPEAEVNYQAKDSIIYDAKSKTLHIFNKAQISYQDIKVNADYIYYSQDSSTLNAFEQDIEVKDSTSKSKITQGEESSTFLNLKYNFKSRRALVENAYSQYGEGFIRSEQVKRNNDQSINGYRNLYTTCNHEVPHFGIAAKKIKIIPNRVAVTGSANLQVEEIPTPLFLPFGLFPLKQGQRSGFKLPTYDMSENLGFGLREGGYYFAINEHIDLLALADIYALGTWKVGVVSTYNYRYRFSGGISANYAYNKIGEEFEPGNLNQRNFFISWNHRIDPKALRGANFAANVNFGSSRYQVNNTYDANLYLSNTYSSNISYSKTWKNKPYNFSAALRHNQNTQTRLVQVTLPELNFSVNQIFPFQFRKDIVKPSWYEKIAASYQLSALNRLDFFDSSFQFNRLRLQDFQNGIKHTVPVNASYNLLKYINFAVGATYNEYWYTQKSVKQFDFQEGKLDTNLNTGFFTARDFSTNATFSTRIYGTKLFKKALVKGIRHVFTPSVSFNYRPDFGSPQYGWYYDAFTDANFRSSRLSVFDGAILGGPPDGRVGGVGFNLGNTLQMKIRSRKDTVTGDRKLNIIDGLNISSFYNVAVDSFRWSNVAISYRTTLLESIQLSGGLSYSPYSINKVNGARSPIYLKELGGKWLRFETANLAITATLPFKKRAGAMQQATPEQARVIGNAIYGYADFNIPWSLNLNYNVSFNKTFLVKSQKDTLQFNQDLNFAGDVNLTSKWKIGFRSGYDFRLKQISYTSLDIFRDLHCWEMRLNLIPFGFRKSYNFALNVKSSVLQDLRLIRRRDFRDNI